MPPSLRGNVEYFQLQAVILHIEDHIEEHIREVSLTRKPLSNIEDPRREVFGHTYHT
jgi:hypothetical protein